MPNFDLFPELLPVDKSRLTRMRLIGTNRMPAGGTGYRFHCQRCDMKTGWLTTPTASQAKRGLPCATCNQETRF
jgi:hypothetical protein